MSQDQYGTMRNSAAALMDEMRIQAMEEGKKEERQRWMFLIDGLMRTRGLSVPTDIKQAHEYLTNLIETARHQGKEEGVNYERKDWCGTCAALIEGKIGIADSPNAMLNDLWIAAAKKAEERIERGDFHKGLTAEHARWKEAEKEAMKAIESFAAGEGPGKWEIYTPYGEAFVKIAEQAIAASAGRERRLFKKASDKFYEHLSKGGNLIVAMNDYEFTIIPAIQEAFSAGRRFEGSFVKPEAQSVKVDSRDLLDNAEAKVECMMDLIYGGKGPDTDAHKSESIQMRNMMIDFYRLGWEARHGKVSTPAIIDALGNLTDEAANTLVYRGNSIRYIYNKQQCSKKTIGDFWSILKENGFPGDGNTPITEALIKALDVRKAARSQDELKDAHSDGVKQGRGECEMEWVKAIEHHASALREEMEVKFDIRFHRLFQISRESASMTDRAWIEELKKFSQKVKTGATYTCNIRFANGFLALFQVFPISSMTADTNSMTFSAKR